MGADDTARGDRDREDDSDEPLPGGYGVRPAARNEGDERGSRSAADRATDQGSEGDGGGRSRRRGRRRRSGEGGRANGGEGSATSESSRRSSRTRRERRPAAEPRGEPRGESRGDAGFARRRRSDFAPVGSGHDEDDEGLEFLGLDESGTDATRRDVRPVTDDILVESGLASVQDVPSWVEAIGIVIAGNLDARSRSTRGDDGRRGGR